MVRMVLVGFQAAHPGGIVLLTDCGSQRLDVVQAVRAVTGLSAWRSSQLLDSLPAVLLERVRFDVAVKAADQIRVSGAGGTTGTTPRATASYR